MLQEYFQWHIASKRPVGVEPVNAAFDTFVCYQRSPSSAPKPLTIFTTPGGRISPINSIKTKIEIMYCWF
jgi:hypothetical protein